MVLWRSIPARKKSPTRTRRCLVVVLRQEAGRFEKGILPLAAKAPWLRGVLIRPLRFARLGRGAAITGPLSRGGAMDTNRSGRAYISGAILGPTGVERTEPVAKFREEVVKWIVAFGRPGPPGQDFKRGIFQAMVHPAEFQAAIANEAGRVALAGKPEEEMACDLAPSCVSASGLVEQLQLPFGHRRWRHSHNAFQLSEDGVGCGLGLAGRNIYGDLCHRGHSLFPSSVQLVAGVPGRIAKAGG